MIELELYEYPAGIGSIHSSGGLRRYAQPVYLP